MKLAVIGSGLRSPLLIHGLVHSGLSISSLVLCDCDGETAERMAWLGRAIAAGSAMRIHATTDVGEAAQDASFVISSIRPGGMDRRARDERLAIAHGFAGQETTGPAGFAMALRTVSVAIEQARIIHGVAPQAWIVNFTNPAGLITQSILANTPAKVVGICDTPAELFFRIALALGEPRAQVECDYLGLNHLGWVRSIKVRGEDVIDRLLLSDDLLASLYPAKLFDPALLRAIKLIPTEYLFFYLNSRTARDNLNAAGATRAAELENLNRQLEDTLMDCRRRSDTGAALRAYRNYLNRRNGSYLRLEGAAESARIIADSDWDPFQAETGYHRIAVETIRCLSSVEPGRIVLNVPNAGAIAELQPDDVVEVPCIIDLNGPRPLAAGHLPATVQGLTLAVKTYENLTIRAAVAKSRGLATLALLANPIVADWKAASNFVDALIEDDSSHFGEFTH